MKNKILKNSFQPCFTSFFIGILLFTQMIVFLGVLTSIERIKVVVGEHLNVLGFRLLKIDHRLTNLFKSEQVLIFFFSATICGYPVAGEVTYHNEYTELFHLWELNRLLKQVALSLTLHIDVITVVSGITDSSFGHRLFWQIIV